MLLATTETKGGRNQIGSKRPLLGIFHFSMLTGIRATEHITWMKINCILNSCFVCTFIFLCKRRQIFRKGVHIIKLKKKTKRLILDLHMAEMQLLQQC